MPEQGHSPSATIVVDDAAGRFPNGVHVDDHAACVADDAGGAAQGVTE